MHQKGWAGLLAFVGMAFASLAIASPEGLEAETNSALFATRSTEQYSFQRGGFSGHFTQWERKNLTSFDGLSATIRIDEIFGNEGDRWASIARISLWEPGSADIQPKWSLLLNGDRKTKRIRPEVLYDEKSYALDAEFALEQPISLVLLVKPAGGFQVSLNGRIFDLPGEMKVGRVGLLASGLQASVDPFAFEQRIH
jgi:hypothetical protein